MARDNDRQRAAGGEFTTKVSLEEVLGVFEQIEGPIVTTGDVAATCDCSSESARQKLFTLEEQGRVKRRKPGQQSFWWRTDNDEEVVDPETILELLDREEEDTSPSMREVIEQGKIIVLRNDLADEERQPFLTPTSGETEDDGEEVSDDE